MTEVVNLFGDDWSDEETRPGFVHRELAVAKRLGAELLGATLYELEPGQAICPYHYHHGEEELALVVSGRVLLRTPAGEAPLEPGCAEVFLQGPAGAHSIRNVGDEPARVIVFSANSDVGVSVYPDSAKVGAWAAGTRGWLAREADAHVGYWEGEG
jgi:uncharacterized cupin superfamily protein